jgi:dihydroflavonol-4-reductase
MAEADGLRGRPVLVTGAGGFLGGNLVCAVRAEGFPVRALVRRPPSGPVWQGLDGVEVVQADIRDLSCLHGAMAGVGAVLHAAALVTLVPRPRQEAFAVNVAGTHNVCEAALRAGVRRLVLTSSACTVAAGTADAPATEETPYNLGGIRAPYYQSKRLAERVVGQYAARGLEVVTLCPAYILGPRDVRPTTNALLLHAARAPIAALPPGGMNIIDVREAALAHVRALSLGKPGQRYVLAGPYCSYADLAAEARRVVGTRGGVHILPSWTRGPGSAVLALAAGLLPRVPNELSVPSFRYGFVAFHVSGARADATFGLSHRLVTETVFDTLRWFQQSRRLRWLVGRRLQTPEPP